MLELSNDMNASLRSLDQAQNQCRMVLQGKDSQISSEKGPSWPPAVVVLQ